MTATCHRAIRSLRACERLNLIAALEATLKGQPLMAAHSRHLALDCRRDARLLQTTSLPTNQTIQMTITQIKTVRYYGLNLTATEALLTLAHLGQTDMSGLASELRVSGASITNIVERLIKDRLVIRSYSRDDRRVIFITLTELGASRVHAITGKPVTMPVTTPITAVPALGLRYSR